MIRPTTRLGDSVALIWKVRHSQVYPELAAMEQDGLVVHDETPGPGPRPKKTYRITTPGREAVAEWLVSPHVPRPPRDELVMRAFAAASAEPGALAAVFEAEAERLDARLATLQQFQEEVDATAEAEIPTRPEFGWSLALLSGLGAATHRRDWCREVARRLRAAAGNES